MKKGERFAHRLLLTAAKQDRDYEDNHGPDKRWQIYGRNHMAYESEFRDLFSQERSPLWNFVRERQAAGKLVVALDIFSEGEALRSLIPDSGLSITLTDHRSAEQKQFDDEHRLTLLAGDALRQQTWQVTQQWLAEHGGSEQRFHLIVERGSGPLVKFPDDPTFEHRLLNRLWKMLSSDHGMMLLQLPNHTAVRLPQWTEQINQLSGVTALSSVAHKIMDTTLPRVYPIIKLTKDQTAPDELPGLIV